MDLQFHLEMTPQSAREIVRHCHEDLVPGLFVQSEETILSAPIDRYAAANALMHSILSFLLKQSG
jgi:hypothetical protein